MLCSLPRPECVRSFDSVRIQLVCSVCSVYRVDVVCASSLHPAKDASADADVRSMFSIIVRSLLFILIFSESVDRMRARALFGFHQSICIKFSTHSICIDAVQLCSNECSGTTRTRDWH